MCIAVTEQAGTITRLPSLLLYEESRFSPSLPWPSSPTETPAAIPAGVSPCFRIAQFSGVRDRTAPATVHGVEPG
jgi:hypothetical protein